MDLTHITQWKLRGGSHEFPGPDGGTCINEAAIVVAGFPYKAVSSFRDLPECFSPVLGQAALVINDMIQRDDVRTHLLMPFVMRFSGSRDQERVEVRRAGILAAGLMDLQWAGGGAPMARSGPRRTELMYALMHEHTGPGAARALRRFLAWAIAEACGAVRPGDSLREVPAHRISYSPWLAVIALLKRAWDEGNQAEPIEEVTALKRMDEARAHPAKVRAPGAVGTVAAPQVSGLMKTYLDMAYDSTALTGIMTKPSKEPPAMSWGKWTADDEAAAKAAKVQEIVLKHLQPSFVVKPTPKDSAAAAAMLVACDS